MVTPAMAEFQLRGMPENLENRWPTIGILADGGFVVAWRGYTSDGQSNDIFIQRFSDLGAPVGNNMRLKGFSGSFQDEAPKVVGMTDGGFVVSWQGETSDGQSRDIFVQRFDALGQTTGEIDRLQGIPGAGDFSPQIRVLSDHGFVVVWQGATLDGHNFDIFVQKFDSFGTKTGVESQLRGRAGDLDDSQPEVSALSHGGFAVVWRGQTLEGEVHNDIFLQVFDFQGMPVGNEHRLQGMAGVLEDVSPQVSELSNNGFVVTWEGDTSDGQSRDIFLQSFDLAGEKFGDMHRLAGITGAWDGKPQITTLTDGKFVVTWASGNSLKNGIFVQLFDANGEALGSIIGFQGMTGKAWELNPTVSELSDGKFVVVWSGPTSDEQGYDIFLQKFDGDGAQLGEIIRLQGMAGNLDDRDPQIAKLTDGDFVVTWHVGIDGQNGDVFVHTSQEGNPSNNAVLDIELASSSGRLATFAVYATEAADYGDPGLEDVQFVLSHDIADMTIDAASIKSASGLTTVPNFDQASGMLTIAGFALPPFTEFSTPILTFDANILNEEGPFSITIDYIITDNTNLPGVVEEFDFSSIDVTTTVKDRFGNALSDVSVSAYEVRIGEHVYLREVGTIDTSSVFEIVAKPTEAVSSIDFDLLDNAGLIDFQVGSALSGWSIQSNTNTPDIVSFAGFGAVNGSQDLVAGQETVIATFTTSIDPDFVIDGIFLNTTAQADISVGEIAAVSTIGNVTVHQVARGSDAYLDADKPIDEASDKAITANDALQALRLAVGLTKSDGKAEWHDYLAADINMDGQVTANDALNILKFAVGLTDGPSADWVFVDGDADWSAIGRRNSSYEEGIWLEDVVADMSVNMTGILVGDVNGSYVA